MNKKNETPTKENFNQAGADAIPAASPAGLKRREFFYVAAALGTAAMLPFGLAQAARSSRQKDHFSAFPQRKLLQADLTRMLDFRNLKKRVQDRKIIDDMEESGGWFASDVVSLGYTNERFKDGTRSMRFSTSLRNEDYIRASREKNGTFSGHGILFAGEPYSAFISKKLSPPQDWSGFNRISLWCYVHPTRNPINSISIQFICDGAAAGPMDAVAVHYFADLRAGEWNHLAWEIPEYQRDRVSQIVIFQTIAGVSVAGADSEIVYDFDQIAVEKIDAEQVQGWQIRPDKIGYSHIGYQTSAEKIAVSGPGPDRFEVLDAATGTRVAQLPAKVMRNSRGAYNVLEFSSIIRPGAYRLRHGKAESEAFRIGENAWLPLVEATLNAFYGLRCGFNVEDAHDACHLDVFSEYQGERRPVGGGWHDAANLTQGPYRTHLSIYALLELHEALQRQGATALAERALEEARWGLEWSIRCRFAPGMRTLYGEYSYWTDGKPGTLDDVVQEGSRAEVGRNAFQNTLASLATARASRVLKHLDPEYSGLLLKAAREDFADVCATISPPAEAPPLEINEPSWRDLIGYLTLCAVELHRATNDDEYAKYAARFAKWVIQTQERRFVDGIPIAGYFYEDAGRTRIVHEYHNSFEDSGLLAFAALCEALPNHPDWMEWYAGLAIYADHFCAKGSAASAPFSVVPAAVWRRADIDAPLPRDRAGERISKLGPSPVFPTVPTPQMIRTQMTSMFEDGVALGGDFRLRVFPLWSDHVRHGSSTVQLSKTIGLGAAAEVMGRTDLTDLTARQMQWILGTNPFSRSLVYGVGYDFWQNFAVSLPNLVGGMSLGFNSYDKDSPAWGNNAAFPYKEMWVYSSCRIAHNLARIGIPARISGLAPKGAKFSNLRTGQHFTVAPGTYDVVIPSGDYKLTVDGRVRILAVAHAATRKLDLNPASEISMTFDVRKTNGSTIDVQLTLEGSGLHQVAARTFNGAVSGLPEKISLSRGTPRKIDLKVSVLDPQMIWILAVVPNGHLQDRIECSGTLLNLAPIG